MEFARSAIDSGVTRDITITAAQDTSSSEAFKEIKKSGLMRSSGFLSSSSSKSTSTSSSTTAIGSNLGGNTVILDAGRDLSVKGSSVIGDNNVTLIADRDITITAAQNTQSTDELRSVRRSGIMGGGGGIFIGSKSQSTDTKQQNISNTGSTIGAIGGDVTILAGNTAKVQGSSILTPSAGGDIIILAKNVEITDLQNTSAQQTETKSRQSGLTVSLGGALVGAAEMAINIAKAISETKDSRAQALGAASAGLYLYNNAKAIGDAANAGQLLSSGPSIAADGSKVAGKQGVFDLSVSVGSSRSQSNSSSQSSTSVGSTLAAGGNITIAATGGGKDSNLTIIGSQLRADNNINLSADNAITLQAGENTASSNSTSKSSSGSIGISLGANTGVTLSGSRSRGNSDGQDVSFTNTEVTAGNNLTITSGGSTALIGANAAGKSVNVDVGKTYGGDLTITSLQDKSTFAEKSRSSGGSITIGPGGIPTGGSVSAGKTNINSNFESVGKQSGIAAGDGGFQVNVQGNTTLTGAVITSTEKAATAVRPEALEGLPGTGLNTFQSGGNVTITDINNKASYSANASNFSAGFSVGKDASGNSKTTPSGSAGIGSASGNSSSVTIGGITGIAGDKTVITGKDTTNNLTPIFNATVVKADINAQVMITAQFGSNASRAIGNYASQQMDEATRLRIRAGSLDANDPERTRLTNEANAIEANWGNNGTLRIAAHTVVGGLTGGASGAAGTLAGTMAAPILQNQLTKAGITGTLSDVIVGLGSTAIGGAVGGAAGAVGALNEVQNNYLTPRENLARNRAAATCAGSNYTDTKSCGEANRLNGLDAKRDRDIAAAVSACQTSNNPQTCIDASRMINNLQNKGMQELQQLAIELAPTCAPPRDCTQAANWGRTELSTLYGANQTLWPYIASGAVQPTAGPVEIVAGGWVSFGPRVIASQTALVPETTVAGWQWLSGSISSAAISTGVYGVINISNLENITPANLAIAAASGALGSGLVRRGLNLDFGLPNRFIPLTTGNAITQGAGMASGIATTGWLNQTGFPTSGNSVFTSPILNLVPSTPTQPPSVIRINHLPAQQLGVQR